MSYLKKTNTSKKKKKQKKKMGGLLKFAVLLAVLLPATFVTGYFNLFYAWGMQQKLNDVTIDAQLMENGDLHISETWVLDLQDRGTPYANGYKWFSTGGFDAIEDLTVYDHDSGTAYAYTQEGRMDPHFGDADTCYIANQPYGPDLELGWFFEPVNAGQRSFTFTYTMTDVATVYSDTAELYVGFIGQNFSLPIENLSITLTLPKQFDNPMVWLHTVANGRIEIQNPGTVMVKARHIEPETLVECRILLHPETLPGSTKTVAVSQKDSILDQEKGFFAVNAVSRRLSAFIVVASAGLLVFSLVPLKRFSKARRHQTSVPEYVREAPSGLSLGVARRLYLFYDDKHTKDVNGGLISALVLSLARKGWLTVEAAGKKERHTVLTVLPGGHEPISGEERPLWEIFTALAEQHGGSFTMEQYAAYGRKEYTRVDMAMQRISAAIKAGFNARQWVENRYFSGAPAHGSVFACWPSMRRSSCCT